MDKELIEKVAKIIADNPAAPYRASNLIIPIIAEHERDKIGTTLLDIIEKVPAGHRVGQIENWCKFYLKDGK